MRQLQLVIISFFLLLFAVQKTTAQYYFYNDKYYDKPIVYEIGGSIGIMNCLTDLGGNKGNGKKFIKDLNFGNTQFAGSIYLSTIYKNAIALRLEGTYGQVKAYDSILKNVKASTTGRYERNLSFRSSITEFMAVLELHPLFMFRKYEDDAGSIEAPRCSPYVVAGIGYFSFNPQAKLLNNWIDLQPLHTEGQGFAEYPDKKPYKLQQLNIPVGVGIKYELSPMLNLRAECMYRILTTDYLDDVSTTYIDQNLFTNYLTGNKLTNALKLHDRRYELDPTSITTEGGGRGNPKNNDAYFTFNFKIGLIFGRERIRK
jgi:Domain of unknown function (DUF6089)